MALRTRPDGRYDITDENDDLVAEAVHPDLVEESLIASTQKVPTDAVVPTNAEEQATGLAPVAPPGGGGAPVSWEDVEKTAGITPSPQPIQPPSQEPVVGPAPPPVNPYEAPLLDKAEGVLGWRPDSVDNAVTGLSSQQASDALKHKLRTTTGYVPPTPAKDTLKTFSVDRMSAVSDPVKADIAGANQEYQSALELQTDINMLKSASMGLQYQKQKDMIDAQIAARAKEKAEQDSMLKPKLAEVDSLADMVNNSKIDPDRFWKNKGEFGSVLAKLGIALGAGAAALTGGPNHVWEQVKTQIDNDVEAQKLEMQNAKNAFEVKDNVYARMKGIFESDTAAAEATRALMYNSLVADTNRMMADIGTGEALAQGQALIAQAKLDAATKRASAEQLEGGQIKENFKHEEARKGGMVTTGPKNADERLDIILKFGKKMNWTPNQAVEWANRVGLAGTAAFPMSDHEKQILNQQLIARQAQIKYQGEISVRDPITGRTVYADNPGVADKLGPKLRDLNLMDHNLFEIQRIVEKNGGSTAFMNIGAANASPEQKADKAKVDALIADSYPAASRGLWENAMQQHEELRSKSLTGDILKDWVNLVNEKEGIKAAREVMAKEIKQARANLRVEPGGAYLENYEVPPPVGQSDKPIPGTPGMKIKK